MVASNGFPTISADLVKSLASLDMSGKEPVVWGQFRIWQALPNPEESSATSQKRVSNALTEPRFEPHRHTLFDYPTIIAARTKANDWLRFNRMVTVQVTACRFRCWHCYNDARDDNPDFDVKKTPTNAVEVVRHFRSQATFDEASGRHSLVLRISGGEPFLAPGFLLKCIELVQQAAEEDQKPYYVWTETSLEPFQQSPLSSDPARRQFLEGLRAHRTGFSLHPCLHGADQSSLSAVTGNNRVNFEETIEALGLLVEHGIDVFPTIHPSTFPPSLLQGLFSRLLSVHPLLPLRVALIETDLRYPAVHRRMQERAEDPLPKLFSKDAGLMEWDRLVRTQFGIPYGSIPRHCVPLLEDSGAILDGFGIIENVQGDQLGPELTDSTLAYSLDEHRLYLCKSGSRPKYQRDMLTMLSLPDGEKTEIAYDSKWIQQDVLNFTREYPGGLSPIEGIIYFGQYMSGKRYFVPIRLVRVEKIDTKGRLTTFGYCMGRFLGDPSVNAKNRKKQALLLERSIITQFGDRTIYPFYPDIFVSLGVKSRAIEQQHDDGRDVWYSVIDGLTDHPDLRKCVYFRLVGTYGMVREDWADNEGNPSQRYVMAEGDSASLRIEYYVPEIDTVRNECSDGLPKLAVSTSDPELLHLLSPPSAPLDKYGTVEINLHANFVAEDSDVVIRLFHEGRIDWGPDLRLPIRIRRKKTERRKWQAVAGTATAMTALILGLVGGWLGSVAKEQGLPGSLSALWNNLFAVIGLAVVVCGLIYANITALSSPLGKP